jgi:hypothetical protein
VLLSATTAQSVLVLLTVSSPGFPLPPQFVTVPARVPGTQSDLQFILSWVRTLALILVAGARLCSAVSSHCSRLGLCCLILDFPPGAKRILILVKILTGGFGLVFEPHNQRLEVFWYMCSWGVFLNTHTRCSVKCVKGSGLLDLFDFSCPSLARAFARID